MNTILRYFAERSESHGRSVPVNPRGDWALLYCKNPGEVAFYLEHLNDQNLIKGLGPGPTPLVSLTAQGWMRVEELERPNRDSKQAFVAMWFDKQLDAAFENGILPLEKETGFNMHRVDKEQFNGKICDHIVAEIRRSRFMIADVTRHRRAVYFEAGYAIGLGLPVIWTCREDAMEKTGRQFDTRQYNHIVWTDPDDLRKQLRDRILATIG